MNKMKTILLGLFCILSIISKAQPGKIIDKVIAMVDNNIILHSDIENQMELLGYKPEEREEGRCQLLDQMLVNKLLVAQAIKDSIPMSEEEVEDELDRKVNYYVNMAGSTEAFESYYNKSIDQIKDDFREDIKDQLLAGRMRNKIVGELTVTPSEVRDFFFKIPSDSLPFFNTEFEVSQIVIDAQISDFQKEYARKTTSDLRDRLLAGESFELLASLYSQDPGSAENGGELGMVPRGTFVKEFDAAAYKLKKDEVSEIVETQFGFHILQLIERRGDLINIRHILIKPKSVSNDLIKARNILDTVKLKVLKLHKDSLTFLQAVNKYSEDELSKSAGGRLINKENGGTIIESKDMDPTVLFIVDTMKVGAISDPVPYMKEDGTQGYRILRLDSKTPPHKANLEQDYDKLQNATKSNKENEEILKWIRKNGRKSYIMIAPEYNNCSNLNNWLTN